MKFNKEIQALADECAQKNQHYAAIYLGPYEGMFLFLAVKQDTKEHNPYKPIVVKPIAGRYMAEWGEGGIPTLNIWDVMKHRNIAEIGCNLYDRLCKSYFEGKYKPEEEEYLRYLDSLKMSGFFEKPHIELEFYSYLEIAERMHKRVEVVQEQNEAYIRIK